MVLFTSVLGYAARAYVRHHGFIDTLRIYVRAGNGGSGIPTYGGIGGTGGNVCLVSEKGISLKQVKAKIKDKKIKAESGSNSSRRGLIGTAGQDLNIKVPCGITAFDENGIKLGELNKANAKLIVAKGGIGGCPETEFFGQKGQARAIILDLKLIADVGLVGFPNAGKSTLLNAISKAKPVISSLPFSTIKPMIGTLQYEDYRQITVADLPGLIEGAHANVGMGHKFLKHLDRTKLLLFVVDIQGFQLSDEYHYRNCLETIVLLNKELELYKPDLLNMPSIIIINKMDTKNANKTFMEIEPILKNLSDFVKECPEFMQPEKILHFDEILTASLILKKKNEIETIKETIRHTLDKYEEEKQRHDSEALDNKLLEKIKKQTRQHTPLLV